MQVLLVFAITLLVAVLLSSLAHRTVISVAVVFLASGILLGAGTFGGAPLHAEEPVTRQLATFALFAVLFTDGMRLSAKELRHGWRLPGRALLLGLPLTLLGTAMLARWIIGLPWTHAFLLGAVLSPTDPVLAAAIVGREPIPGRLRHLLNVESGLNDGLAVPLVILTLALAAQEKFHPAIMAEELLLGIALGIGIPWLLGRVEHTRYFATSAKYEPLYAFSVGLVLLAAAEATHANLFLAAFTGGITMATVSPDLTHSFHRFGELIAELLKLAALLLFGALISLQHVTEISWPAYSFALLALLAVRPVAVLLALAGSGLPRAEKLSAGWFGPKGFASVVFALYVVKSGLPGMQTVFHLAALVITASIVLHSSSDILVARWFERQPAERQQLEAEPSDRDPAREQAEAS